MRQESRSASAHNTYEIEINESSEVNRECSKCLQVKPLRDFYQRRRGKKGDLHWDTVCKDCKKQLRRSGCGGKGNNFEPSLSTTQKQEDMGLSSSEIRPLTPGELSLLVSIFSDLRRWKIKQIREAQENEQS